MILLDTNVLSEVMRPRPAPRVIDWLDRQPADRVWFCATVRAEIELGLALLPEGQRKQDLLKAARAMFIEDLSGRCLPFDDAAALHYAEIVAARMRMGRPICVEDAQIAATALAHGMLLATRNGRDFEEIDGLGVVDPWQEA